MKRIIIAALASTFALMGMAQDFGLWTSAGVKKSLNSKLSIEAEGEFRTQDGLSKVDRWTIGAGLDYKIASFLKFDAGYKYIYGYKESETTKKGNIVSSYWQSRHRVFASLTGKVEWNRFEFSLRERWQYTYRPSQSVAKYDGDDGSQKADEYISGKCKHVLRSRLEVEYNIKKCPITPYVSCELYNLMGDGWDHEKTRWTVGGQYKINKKHALDIFYRYQDESDDDENSGHAIGIGYVYKF